MAFLEHDGNTTELRAGETRVGSGKEAGFRLQQMDLAPHHLTLMTGDDGTTVVRPYGAHLIVTVNGKRITEPTRLNDGDLIGAGGARVRYVMSPNARVHTDLDESAWLVSMDGSIAYTLARKTITIGRDASSTVQIRDPEISRQHADISAEAGLHLLHALAADGVKVNGEKTTATRVLEEGDRIDIGELRLRYTRTPPPAGTKISTGGEMYDLEVSRMPTGKQLRITDDPARVLNSPKVLRVVAIIVGLMALTVLVLLFAM